MDKFLRILKFLRITDEQDNLSLTNIALVAVLARTLCLPDIDTADVLGLMFSIGGYQVKRWLNPMAPGDDVAALKSALESLQTKVVALQMGQQRVK